jgi:hypothetical protein
VLTWATQTGTGPSRMTGPWVSQSAPALPWSGKTPLAPLGARILGQTHQVQPSGSVEIHQVPSPVLIEPAHGDGIALSGTPSPQHLSTALEEPVEVECDALR